MIKNFFYASSILLLISCGSARKINYSGVNADLPKSNTNISMAVWDQRIQVTDGSRKPDFVGYMRSGTGIAYPMRTKSGKPFVNDMSATISSALKESGTKVVVVETKFSDSRSMILNRLKEHNAPQLLLVKCNDYHTDGYGSQALIYDIDVLVFDNNGNVLKERKFSGKKPLGGNGFWGAGKYKTYMPAGLKILVEEIFHDEDLSRALIAKS